MGGRRRAFALMTSLVTASAVFAAALALAVATRASLIESGALSRSLESELRARTAAARALSGVVGEGVTPAGGADPEDPGGASDGPEVDTDELPEMPDFLREFLEAYLEEPEGDADEDAPSASSSSASSSERASRQLRARGLPSVPVTLTIDNHELIVTLSDAMGGLNINSAESDELSALFELAGAEPLLASSLAAQLIDYRDPDNFVSPRGAEAAAYLRRNLIIPNKPMQAVEELLYLPDMTPDLFRRVRPLVTLHGDGALHAPTAPIEAIAAVSGVGVSGAETIISLRESGMLDADSLRDALSLFSEDAAQRFRFTASPLIRVRVAPTGQGPVFTSVAAITDEGLRWAPFIQE